MMPLAVTFSAFGISMARPLDLHAELARHAKASSRLPPPVMAPSALNTSTLMSKVPSRPVSRGRDAAAALRRAAAEAQGGHIDADRHRQDQLAVLELRLGQRDGRALQRQRAQRQIALVPVAAVATAEIVNTSSTRMAATALSPLPTRQLPAAIWTLTSPATKVSFGSTPVRGVSRYR
jgi:hypothetical protein